jgi:hypothetical protein
MVGVSDKIKVPKNSPLYLSLGTGLTSPSEMLKTEAPESMAGMTVQQAIDYVLSSQADEDEGKGALAANVERTMRAKRGIRRKRNWAVELNGSPVYPSDSLDSYLDVVDPVDKPTPINLAFKVSKMNGGGYE